ncbi:hypothetical protein, partial [Streptomyces galilaeus]|uniref:hypothetical protein n=1 Tax=Streptomyces galilaeus TaxID=33899 RepID=UPI0038F7931A
LEPNDPNYHGSLGHGIYMGAERSTAEGYGQYVHEGDVRMDNPLVIDAHESINHNYLTPSAYDESWTPYRVTDDNTGKVLYDGDDEDRAREIEESHPNATFTNKYDTDEFVPESV